jgi:triosephosphate isomerase
MSDTLVHAQLVHAYDAGLTAVLCVGEQSRDAAGAYFAVVEEQLRAAFGGLPHLAKKVVVAYEPVWAIGKSAESALPPQELEEMVIFIRKILADILTRPVALKVPILYGAAVEADNANALIVDGGVQGLLVGHASATVDSFLEILKSVRPTHGKHAKN